MPRYFVRVGRKGGFYVQVAAPGVDLNQVCERGLHVRLMVRIRCSRIREGPRAVAIGEIISEERSDDPVDTDPKQRIYEECGQRPEVPPPLRLPGATIGAVMLDRWVLWCAPMRHFIRRRAGPRKIARLCMPRITHKFAVLFQSAIIRILVCRAASIWPMICSRIAGTGRSRSVTTAICMPRRRSAGIALIEEKARLSTLTTRSRCPWSDSRRRRLKDNTRTSRKRASASRAPYRKQCVRSCIVSDAGRSADDRSCSQ